jgi:hypothetical protein
MNVPFIWLSAAVWDIHPGRYLPGKDIYVDIACKSGLPITGSVVVTITRFARLWTANLSASREEWLWCRVCRFPHRPSRASPQGRTGLPSLQGTTERRSERHRVPGAIRTRTAQTLILVPPAIGLRGQRAATRGRTGPSAVRRRSRSRARRPSCPSWIRTTIHGSRGRCPAVGRKGIE